MKRDRIFAKTAARASDFQFDAEVAKVFDDMLLRSIPFYLEQQHMIREIAGKFWIPGTRIYDLGASTATTLINIAQKLDTCKKLVGYDNSRPMIERAKRRIKESGLENRIEMRFGDLNGDLTKIRLRDASVVMVCWTLQFIRPLRRDNLIRRIYNALAEDGVLVVTDKVLTNDSHMNRFFIDFYYDFKRRNGYSSEEILRKREALENVLIPYRTDENLEMFRRNRFEIVETFFQWYNFAGFLCVKKPGSSGKKS